MSHLVGTRRSREKKEEEEKGKEGERDTWKRIPEAYESRSRGGFPPRDRSRLKVAIRRLDNASFRYPLRAQSTLYLRSCTRLTKASLPGILKIQFTAYFEYSIGLFKRFVMEFEVR